MSQISKTCDYFVAETREQVGTSLRSLLLYGSALTDDFIPKRSDFNFALIADPLDVPLLDRLAGRARHWRKKRIPVPLLFTPRFVDEARDSYPLEFLSMKARYEVLAGDDLLAAVEVQKPDVRLQCERELRSKLLLFRRVYVETEGKAKRLQEFVARGLPALAAIVRGMLFLREKPWDAMGRELWSAAAEHLGVPEPLMIRLQEVRSGRRSPSKEEVRRDMEELVPLFEKLAIEVDKW